ncbi:MAG: MATE family efflux transporter [Ruminococcus sp.]|nr:MATE family efflux transporter [Ruminococcus sp.]
MLNKNSKVHDMTNGNIYRNLITYSFPVFVGSLFQLFYNIIDTIIVGRFISTEALAAVGSTGLIINIMVYFFLGFSVGAGVLVGQCFGAKDKDSLREAIQTTLTVTFILCIILTVVGYGASAPMLKLIGTPEDVFNDAFVYMRIYCIGISGLLIYNIGGEILRAVGNTLMPLYFLIFSSVANVVLDLVFVLAFDAGVAGVAWATVIAQFLSAMMILVLLTRTKEIYRLEWRNLHVNLSQVKTIFKIGMPAGLQSMITGFANLLAQSYINALGAACMAGWSCFNKLLSIAMLPTGALSSATTNFVSQNTGAKNYPRIKEGITKSNLLNFIFSMVITVVMFIFAEPLIGIYTTDPDVIRYGAIFMHWIIFSIIVYSIGNNLISAMIAAGDSMIPTLIKLSTYVGLRILYLFIIGKFFTGTATTVSLAFPISWTVGAASLYIYYKTIWKNRIGNSDEDTVADIKSHRHL